MRHSSSQLTLQGAGCDRQWIVWDGVGPTVRTGQPLCCSRLQQMLVQMPGTSVSLTSLIATTHTMDLRWHLDKDQEIQWQQILHTRVSPCVMWNGSLTGRYAV